MEIVVSSKRVVQALAAMVCILVVLHACSFIPEIRGLRDGPINLFYLNGENNLPSLFSTLLLFSCSILCWIVSRARQDYDRYRWFGLSLIYLYLGMDEELAFHERVSQLLFHCFPGLGLMEFVWVIPYALILLVLMVVYVGFWWRLPRPIKLQLALGGALFVGGGMGFESLAWLWASQSGGVVVHQLEILIEEILEMAGSIVMIYALMNYIGLLAPGFRVSVVVKRERGADADGG